jgi:hypothetical protein
MKERKKNTSCQNDTEKLKRRNQVAVTRLRTGYSRATHRNKMKGTRLLVLQHKFHTRTHPMAKQRNRGSWTKKVWEKGAEGVKMLVEYMKNIELYYGL